jgi:hypothetical protein
MNKEIIQSFCKSRDPSILHKLEPNAKELLIDGCFSVLFQKIGDQDLAAIALEELGEVKRLRYKANKAEGISDFKRQMGLSTKDARKDWKKLSKHKQWGHTPWIHSFVYTGARDFGGYQALKRTGATTVKVIDKKDLTRARAGFINATLSFPEYKRELGNPNITPDGHPLLYTLGGFAAFGNPASFHNTYVRKKRIEAREAVLPLFQTIVRCMHNNERRNKTKFQMLADRMMYRYVSQAPSAESWHRDVTPAKYLSPGDEMYGGWLNLDLTQTQYLSCIPGSHLGLDLRSLREGFASLGNDAIKVVKPYKTRIAVPPGHMIIFPQYLLHEVVSTKAKYDMMRIFTGWRTTTSSDFLIPVTGERMKNQGIFPLPSGQEPPVFSANHGSFFRNKAFRPIPRINDWKVSTVEWSAETFKEEGPTGVPITITSKNKSGTGTYKLVNRFMRSLRHYKLPMYPPYSKKELSLYLPQNVAHPGFIPNPLSEEPVPIILPEKALSILPRWLDLILSGQKTVELRGGHSTKREITIGLIQSGSGAILGECTFIRSEGPLTPARLFALRELHQLEALEGAMDEVSMYDRVGYRRPHAWFLRDVRRYPHPVPYKHPQGAVIFIDLKKSFGASWPRAQTVPGFVIKRKRYRRPRQKAPLIA